MIRTINNIIRTLQFQTLIPPTFWVEALHMATHILNISPSTSTNNVIPFVKRYNKKPSFSHLRVFGFQCYPYLSPPHKLSPRSSPCVFLGYPTQHRGYRCLELSSRKIILSQHVTFDESIFPLWSMTISDPSSYSFLEDDESLSPLRSILLDNSTPPSPPATPIEHQTEPATTSSPLPHPPTPPATHLDPPPVSHPIVTRSRHGISKPMSRLNLHTSSESPLPKSHLHALLDPHWTIAMQEEYDALISNGTWTLVPSPPTANIVRSIWLFKKKYKANGSLDTNVLKTGPDRPVKPGTGQVTGSYVAKNRL